MTRLIVALTLLLPQLAHAAWTYQEAEDKMTGKQIKMAACESSTRFWLDFPYQGGQQAVLRVRSHPTEGTDVLVTIDRGQLMDKGIKARFDDGEPVRFETAGPADHSTEILFILDKKRFLDAIKESRKAFLELQFFQGGAKMMEFDTGGLVWP